MTVSEFGGWSAQTTDDPMDYELDILDRLAAFAQRQGMGVTSSGAFTGEDELLLSVSVHEHDGVLHGVIVRAPRHAETEDGEVQTLVLLKEVDET